MGITANQPYNTLAAHDAFLTRHGWQNATRIGLPGDFSSRHYVRLDDGGRKALLMIMPKSEELQSFITMQHELENADIRVPAIFASDTSSGLALVEDLGEQNFNSLLSDHTPPEALYALAVDVLINLHRAQLPVKSDLFAFTPDVFSRQVHFFIECYAQVVLQKPFTQEAISAFRAAWNAALEIAVKVPSRLMLRDYHAANIMYLPHETAHKKAAVIDFQDGGIGPITYDLISLLEDARLDVAPDMRQDMLDKYIEQAGVKDVAGFMQSYHILAAQRHMRILGILAKRWHEKAIPVTGEYFQRVWQLVMMHRHEPALANVFAWLDAYVPAHLRADWKP